MIKIILSVGLFLGKESLGRNQLHIYGLENKNCISPTSGFFFFFLIYIPQVSLISLTSVVKHLQEDLQVVTSFRSFV